MKGFPKLWNLLILQNTLKSVSEVSCPTRVGHQVLFVLFLHMDPLTETLMRACAQHIGGGLS